MDPNEWQAAGECPGCGQDTLRVKDYTRDDGMEMQALRCVGAGCHFEYEGPRDAPEVDWGEYMEGQLA